LEASRATGEVRLVLVVLATLAHADGVAIVDPTLTELAARARLLPEEVEECLQSAVELGELEERTVGASRFRAFRLIVGRLRAVAADPALYGLALDRPFSTPAELAAAAREGEPTGGRRC
jgi:hypothetical protein